MAFQRRFGAVFVRPFFLPVPIMRLLPATLLNRRPVDADHMLPWQRFDVLVCLFSLVSPCWDVIFVQCNPPLPRQHSHAIRCPQPRGTFTRQNLPYTSPSPNKLSNTTPPRAVGNQIWPLPPPPRQGAGGYAGGAPAAFEARQQGEAEVGFSLASTGKKGGARVPPNERRVSSIAKKIVDLRRPPQGSPLTRAVPVVVL